MPDSKHAKTEEFVIRIMDIVMDLQAMETEGLQAPVVLTVDDYHELRTAEVALMSLKSRLAKQ